MGAEALPACEDEQWLSVAEAAEYLDVSEPTIWRWMAEGALASSWMNGSSRFTRQGLDSVIRETTGSKEMESNGTCAVCGHSRLIAGHVQDIGRLYFRPSKARFWVLREAVVPLAAGVCTGCGHVQLHADIGKLKRLIPAEQAETS